MPLLLRYGLVLSFLICVVALSFEIVSTLSFGKTSSFARPKARGLRGVLYAFGRGMMPWEKESAAKHPFAYFAGIVYHVGIFATLFYLFCVALFVQLGVQTLSLLRLLFVLGFLSGWGLFLRRVFSPRMRKLSNPDDYASNLIVSAVLVLSAIDTYFSSAAPVGRAAHVGGAEHVSGATHLSSVAGSGNALDFAGATQPTHITWLLLLASTIMFLYIPFGKIRHCFFFFYARVLLGRFYGRRGVLPPKPARYKG